MSTDDVLAAIDGALADLDIPGGMRWSPDPAQVSDAPAPFDGELVWQPPQRYELSEPLPRINLPAIAPSVEAQVRTSLLERLAEEIRVAAAYGELPVPVQVPRLLLARPAPDPGVVEVRQATPQEAADFLRRLAEGVAEAMRPIAEEVLRIGQAIGDALAGIRQTPAPRPLSSEATVEELRAAVLDARRHRNTGPPLLGPERCHAPRRIR